VGDVEDTSAQWADANDNEIDHFPSDHSVDPVRRTAGDDESRSNEKPAAPAKAQCRTNEREKYQTRSDCEESGTSRGGQCRAQAQKGALVLRVFQAHDVREVRSAWFAREGDGGEMLRCAVAANRTDYGNEQHETRADSSIHADPDRRQRKVTRGW